WVELAGPTDFNVTYLNNGTFMADFNALDAFQKRYAELIRVGQGLDSFMDELEGRVAHVKRALLNDPDATPDVNDRIRVIERQLKELDVVLNGDTTITSRNEEAPKSISGRLFGTYGLIPFVMASSISNVTQEVVDSINVAEAEVQIAIDQSKALDAALGAIESELDDSAPWTPGRVPQLRIN
ncbi:MAG: hypothetical protein ACTSU8_01220, partial [Alphaproteobacteria bacterium]